MSTPNEYPVTIEIGDENTGIVSEVTIIALFNMHEDEAEIIGFKPSTNPLESDTGILESNLCQLYQYKVDKSQIEDAIVQKVFANHEDDRSAELHEELEANKRFFHQAANG